MLVILPNNKGSYVQNGYANPHGKPCSTTLGLLSVLVVTGGG